MTAAVADALSDAAGALRRSTVRILHSGRAIGSGIIWREDGLIITNAHVACSAHAIVEDLDGRRFPARLEARNPGRDLAALKIDATGLPVLPNLTNAQLRVGELVLALGNPLGVPGAIVTGIVHATGAAEGLEHRPWIQADIRLAPGNSGGPLADARCRVAGVNSMIAGGLGLAVPANSVEKFLRGGTDQPTIGISVQAVRIEAAAKPMLGLYVEDVATGSPAARSGIRAGDVLIGYAEKQFRKATDLFVAMRSGDRAIALNVLRANRQVRIEVPLTA
jgi:serine protease Do